MMRYVWTGGVEGVGQGARVGVAGAGGGIQGVEINIIEIIE